jgi:hypothetical protein
MAITITERAKAIQRAKRALKALTQHPDTSQQQLGIARDRLIACYRLTDAKEVCASVGEIERLAASVHGVPDGDEPSPGAVSKWVSPRGRPRPARPRRARRAPPN